MSANWLPSKLRKLWPRHAGTGDRGPNTFYIRYPGSKNMESTTVIYGSCNVLSQSELRRINVFCRGYNRPQLAESCRSIILNDLARQGKLAAERHHRRPGSLRCAYRVGPVASRRRHDLANFEFNGRTARAPRFAAQRGACSAQAR
jgi:hypothetical protein